MRKPPEPAWLDDPTLTVAPYKIAASLAFEKALLQHKRVLLDEKEARVAKKPRNGRQPATMEGS